MDKQQYDVVTLLEYIDPSSLDYNSWLQVGMGLKEAGHKCDVWDDWSRQDTKRYHQNECGRKWETFRGTGSPITAGTIVQLARDYGGWRPPERDGGTELAWDDIIGGKDELVVVNQAWIEGREVVEPDAWDPVQQITTYLETLFEAGETVGYVTEAWQKDGRYLPGKGAYTRTAGELIEQLNKYKDDICSAIGDYKAEAGAWIRFNPLDGKGVKNENVTEFRYALVESDDMEIDRQNAIIRELELPVACLVHSGGKSLHAIVRVEAGNYDEYRKRVDYLYDVCKKNGLKVDGQNKNPSRLSRMPGIMRNGHKQFLVNTNIGKENWTEWKDWIESVNDDLPDPETLDSVWDNLPDLSPSLIDGLLRQGHKMLLAGPSKAGKSYALIELCIAIAEGRRWIQWACTKGKILYVNLELDRASCLHRFKDVYQALGYKPLNLANIDIWNLRGKSVPMDKLAPKLIRRAAKKNYLAIVIDPIYKVITGDENSADQMAHFCNQFDKVCTELGCAVIYCHHHSKGGQGQKRSMDRASGSGVFARDPDALLDLIELEVNEDLLKYKQNETVCSTAVEWLDKHSKTWEDHVSQDDMCSASVMRKTCDKYLLGDVSKQADDAMKAAEKRAESLTAWRIEGTLREFPRFAPVNLWFDYPVHHIDQSEALKDVGIEGEQPPWQRAMSKRKPKEDKKKERVVSIETAYDACNMDGNVKLSDLAEYMGVTEKTIRNRLKEHGGFWIDEGAVGKKT